jgi:hypothetical protein
MAESPLLTWRQRDEDELLYDTEERLATALVAQAIEDAVRETLAARPSAPDCPAREDLPVVLVLKARQAQALRWRPPGEPT